MASYCIPIIIVFLFVSVREKRLPVYSCHWWIWNCYSYGVVELQYLPWGAIDTIFTSLLQTSMGSKMQMFTTSSEILSLYRYQARPGFPRFLVTLAGTNRKADMDFSSSAISISSGSFLLCVADTVDETGKG